MEMGKGLVFGLIAGAIGAAIWAAIAYFTGYEVAWIAWLVGAMVGIGVAAGCNDNTGGTTGVLAAVLALASICAGKYIVIHVMATKVVKQVQVSTHVDAERAQRYMARDLCEHPADPKVEMVWPAGKDQSNVEKLDDYPAVVVKDVRARWAAMTPEAQANYQQAVEDDLKQTIGSKQGKVEAEAFSRSFGIIDVVFFGLALFTAFKIGSGSEDGGGGD